MDALSFEFQDFLVRLGRNPSFVSGKVEHYIKHILHLLSVEDEQLVICHYGLFGKEPKSLDELAKERGVEREVLLHTLESSLRKLAITPEWQMVKQFANRSQA